MTNEEVASQSQIAIEAVEKDVLPSRLNTQDGAFPSGKEIEVGGLGD